MKSFFAAAALICLATSASAQTPQPADWTTLTFTASLNKGADIAWARIGGNELCAIQKFLDITCEPVSGKGELGSVRQVRLANSTTPIIENIVARSRYSYTYAQPFTPIFYHGSLTVEPVDATHSRLVYTLLWNQNAVGDAAAQAAARDSRRMRFQAAVDKMTAAANAP